MPELHASVVSEIVEEKQRGREEREKCWRDRHTKMACYCVFEFDFVFCIFCLNKNLNGMSLFS